MTQNVIGKVQVISSDSDEVGIKFPKALTKEGLENLANAINSTVLILQENIVAKNSDPDSLPLSEVELTFGVDLEAQTNIPIFGPLVNVGFKSATTFQVRVKLSKE